MITFVEFHKFTKTCFVYLLLLVMSSACGVSLPNHENGLETTPQPRLYRPFSTRWEPLNQPAIDSPDIQVIVYGIRISGGDTLLIYAVSGSGANALTDPDAMIQMRDGACISRLYRMGKPEGFQSNRD